MDERDLALALVMHAETIVKIRRLAMPTHRRLTTGDLNSRLAAIHTLCTTLREDLEREKDTDAKQDLQAPGEPPLDGGGEQRR